MAACGKITYLTPAAAYRAVRKLKGRHGPAQRAYRCPACTSANDGIAVWHLTSEMRHESDHCKPMRQAKRPRRWRWHPQELYADE